MYRFVDAMVIRVATRRCTDSEAGWPDLADTSHGRVDRWRSWLRQVCQLPDLLPALEVASPVLVRRVERICAGSQVDERDIRSAVRSVTRYLLRATGRATPFGLFAGVAIARLGHPEPEQLGTEQRPVARIESEWLADVITRLESCRELRRRLLVVRTNLAFVRDGRLVVGCQQTATGEPGEVSVRHATATRAILDAAETPIVLSDLAAKIATDFPHASATAIDTMLAGMVAQRILISTLWPPMTATDPLSHVVDVLGVVHAHTMPAVAALTRDLRDLHATLARHDTALSPSMARDLRVRVERKAVSIAATERPISLDLRLGNDVLLPPAVAREAEAVAAALVRLGPHLFGPLAWQDYHGRFVERYGVGSMVPVEELLHGDTGLGFPAGYRDARLMAPARPGLSERDGALLALAQTAVLRNTELVLDEPLITRLAVADIAEAHVQPHTELRVRVHATTADALRNGDFELAVLGVARTAGATTGRFLDLFSDADQARMSAAYAALPTVSENAIPVQVSGPTLYPRADNVARTPLVLPRLLSLGEHGPDADGLVPISDLVVVGDAHRLYLWSLSHQAPVEPVVFSAVEFVNHAHPVVRFLCEIATARAAACAPFSWGAAANRLPVLPRVRYRRSILAPARWVLASADLPDAAAPWQDWADRFAAWRREFRVPANVYLGETDQRMRLDLTEPAHVHVLRSELGRAGHVEIREAPDDKAFGWLDGHAHEVVIPLAASTPALPGRNWARRVVRRDHGHLPAASPWLYVKLYGHPDRQNAILTTHLPALLSMWDAEREWWFLRYTDPEHHLRLRFRLQDNDFASAAERIAAWVTDLRSSGLVAHMQLDTYYPETGRFGPGAAMTAAETVFAADSAAAITQLTATTRRDGEHRHAVTAASMVNLAVAATGDIDAGMRWLIGHAATPSAPPLDCAVRNAAMRLADPGNDWAALRAIPDGGAIARAWQRRRSALDSYRAALAADNDSTPGAVLPDLLHLHHVRMTGIDSDTERACTRLARAAALSWTTRTRGGAR